MIPIPTGMTADKLREVANYITAADNIIAQMLDLSGIRIERDGVDETNEWSELVAGRAMQEDLRAWADYINDPANELDPPSDSNWSYEAWSYADDIGEL